MSDIPKNTEEQQQKNTDVGVTADVSADLLIPENKESEALNLTSDKVRPKTAQVISSFEPNSSLQDKFKEFKRQRQEKYKNKQYLKNKKINDRTTKEFQDLLRSKFIETAKKYLGVPYAKRYLKPEDQNYNSPLFLDCCALVRQVVYDLREDFGFTLGRWNQAYQFDILPMDIKLEDARPGDLVFISGTYYDPKKKQQRHNMVHVEIFLGGPTGEQSIGARWNNGVVSIFDSYKFVSKSYGDMKYYFKSIDTWLEGICKNYCDKHIWEIDRAALGSDKFSVFADAEEAEQDDDGENADTSYNEEAKLEAGDSKQSDQSKIKATKAKRVFIGKGNNEKLIRNYFTDDKFTILDQKLAFSSKYDLRWVQLLHEVDFLSFKEGEQIVNHIPNINIIAAKNGLLQTLRDFEANNPNFEGLKMSEFMPPSFRLDILSDEILFLNSPNDGIWITKPYNANRGINLKIVKDIAKFKEEFLSTNKFNLGKYVSHEAFRENLQKSIDESKGEKNDEEPIGSKTRNRTVIQKYIDNPLLLNNKKFDIRCYMLIATTKPLFVLFHHGYCRLSINDKGELDKLAHITNNSIQKKHPNYTELKDSSIWTMKALEEHLQKNLEVPSTKIQDIYHDIKKMLAHSIRCAEFKLDKKLGYFELLGCDVLLDENLKPHLIEINSNPALSTIVEGHRQIIPGVVQKTLDLILSLNEDASKLSEILKQPEKLSLGDFEILFNKETGFIYQ